MEEQEEQRMTAAPAEDPQVKRLAAMLRNVFVVTCDVWNGGATYHITAPVKPRGCPATACVAGAIVGSAVAECEAAYSAHLEALARLALATVVMDDVMQNQNPDAEGNE